MPDIQCSACPNWAVAQWQRRAADDPAATVSVFVCAQHTITRDSASRVHAAGCTAPDPARLPGCDCTPEPLPAPEPIVAGDTITLDTGWVVPAPEAT